MRVEDLNHTELLQLDPDGGLIRFMGQRALLVDAVAMGLLRLYLVENFGTTAARVLLTQFGFAHGWRAAAAMKNEFQWIDREEWRLAGPHIYALEGLFRIHPGNGDVLSEKGVMLLASYEAEQHLLHFGRAESTVCWTICGLLSGYASYTTGKEVFVLEDRCLGHGHVSCHLLGRTREEWGDERADDLAFFEKGRLKDCLDVSLGRVIESLKSAETKLITHRLGLVKVAPEAVGSLGIVAKSDAMQKVVDLARRVAQVDSTVLITGESGTGKERIARLVHNASSRALGPFIAFNCGAIVETLLESELFGHARGAFTGATTDRPGLFEAANHGTLLLDEIGEVSPAMQVKLLRVLQEHEVRRVGENRSRPVNARIIAATNRNLARGVEESSFRQDLYYRLKVVELEVPPLRKRREDIFPLARILLAEAAERLNRDISTIAPEAANQLLRYEWPGNVRELQNVMERAVALSRGTQVELDDLPEEIIQAFALPVATTLRVEPLYAVEKGYTLSVLKLNEGNQAETARELEISVATLYRRLKKYREEDGAMGLSPEY